jgi:hypothetical protein
VAGVPWGLWSGWLEGRTLWTQRLASGPGRAHTLSVPLPDECGRYRLLSTARLPAGGVVRAAHLLDTRGGTQARVDVPPLLQPGDRTFLALALTHGAAADVAGRIKLQTGGGLAIESVTCAGEGVAVEEQTVDAVTFDARVPAGERVWYRVWVEAAQPGPHEIALTGRLGAQPLSQAVGYEVAPAPAGAMSAEAVQVTRSCERWTGENLAVELEGGRPVPGIPLAPAFQGNDSRSFEKEPWTPGERLRPGQYLLVREQILTSRALENARWVQPMPANGFGAARAESELAQFGAVDQPQGRALRYRIDRLPVGEYVHEYLVEAVRPGVCRLPAPQLRVDGVEVPVTLAEEMFLPVTEPLGSAGP